MKMVNGIATVKPYRCKYALLYPETAGIKMVLSDTIDDKAIVRSVRSTAGTVYMQKRLITAYGLIGKNKIEQLSPNEYYIHAQSFPKDIPTKFTEGIIDDRDELPRIPKTAKEKLKTLHKGRVTFSPKTFRYSYFIVELHRGEHCYISIKGTNDVPYDIPCYTDLTYEYGNYLADCVTDSVRFWKKVIYHTDSNSSYKAFNIPSEWLRSCGFNYNGQMRFVELSPGSAIVIPLTKICGYDGKVIDPMEEKATKAYLCEECASPENEMENEDIINLMKNLDEKMNILIQLQKEA